MRRLLAFITLMVCASAQEQTFHGTIYFSKTLDLRTATGSTAPIKHITVDLSGSCGSGFGLALNTTNKKLFWCNPGTGNWELALTFGASGGGGDVASVFSRTGAVTAQSGDYTAAQVTNAIDSTQLYPNPSWLTSLAWAKLTGVPSTFTPAPHTHASTDITDWTPAVRAAISTANSGRLTYSGGAFDLASGIVTPGTYTSVTVDTYGRVTAGTNPGGSGCTFASQAEAEDGTDNTKCMTPLRTSQAIAKLTPLPETPSLGYLKYNETITQYQPFWAIEPTATALSAAGNSITCNRSQIAATPASTLTLTSTPTVADGVDGQFCTITNVSTTNSLTLQDAANLASSGLRFGGTNVTLGPRASIALVYNAALDSWLRASEAPGGGGPGQVLKDLEFITACTNDVPSSSLNLAGTFGDANTPIPRCVYGSSTIAGVLEFDTNGQYATKQFRLPPGTVAVTATVRSRTAATTGNSVWTLTNTCIASGVVMGTGNQSSPAGGPTLSNSNSITIAAGSANVGVDSTETTLTIGSCAPNQIMFLRIARSASTTVANPPQLESLNIRAKN